MRATRRCGRRSGRMGVLWPTGRQSETNCWLQSFRTTDARYSAHGWLRLSNWTRQGAIRASQWHRFIVRPFLFTPHARNNTYMQISVFLPHTSRPNVCTLESSRWFCERLDLKHIVHKRRLFFEGVIKLTEYCITDVLWIVYTLEGICSVVLQVWYRCSFVSLSCYFCCRYCSFSKSVWLLSILFLVTVCFMPSLANKRHH